MNVEVREYQEEDLPFVNEILEESFSVLKKNFSGEEFYEVVATVDGKVAGYLLLTRILNPVQDMFYYFVDYVCVLNEYRGMGIGQALLSYAEGYAKGQGAKYLQLTCSRFRVAAHKLYEKCDFIKRDSDIYRKEII